MTEQEALERMVPPGKPRPHIWRKGVLQVHVTRACDKACFGCTQGSNLGGKPVVITTQEYEQALLSLKGYFGVVGMFGGNPTMHPEFEELCSLLRKHVPWEQRGLWSNKLLGKGSTARRTFNPAVSNLNVHLDREAYDEFWRDWPEARSVVKGHDTDSRHSPPFVSMSDVGVSEERRWDLIGNCDINQNWSAMLCAVPGKGLRAFFCEIAGSMAMLHAGEEDWPDVGMEVTPGWWQKPMQDFAQQVRTYCHQCGIPLRRYGQLAVEGDYEEVSQAHQGFFKTKRRDRRVELVTVESGPTKTLDCMTNYIENGGLK